MKQRTRLQFLIAAALTLLFVSPWFMTGVLGIEHDTFFHLSRIQGMAEALSRLDFYPVIYPMKNGMFGYASSLFYCDLFVVPFSLLYLLGVSLAGCYKLMLATSVFLTAFATLRMCARFSRKLSVCTLVTAAWLFCNYRVTDFYVRSAVGEIMAMCFLPVLISGMYDLFVLHRRSCFLLTLALCGLVLTHNLTFLMAMFLGLLFLLFYARKMDQTQWKTLLKSCVLAFLLTAWFTLPMIEQLLSQDFILDYYASHSDLAAGALPLWKYFANTTVFGYGGKDQPKEKAMLLNVGFFLEIVPLFYPIQNKKDRFTTICFVLGLVFLILPGTWVPWNAVQALDILQFPWRLLTLSSILLTIPALCVLDHCPKRNIVVPLLLISVLLEGFIHVLPVKERTFGITRSTPYSDLIDGTLIDPYFSASYVRTELAGGDYLPLNSVDFRTFSYSIHDETLQELPIPFTQEGTSLSFYAPRDGTYVLPMTYYKGITAESNGATLPTSETHGLVQVTVREQGQITVRHKRTLLQVSSGLVSLAALVYLIRKKQTASR